MTDVALSTGSHEPEGSLKPLPQSRLSRRPLAIDKRGSLKVLCPDDCRAAVMGFISGRFVVKMGPIR